MEAKNDLPHHRAWGGGEDVLNAPKHPEAT